MKYQCCPTFPPIAIGEPVHIVSATNSPDRFCQTCGMKGNLVAVTDDGYGKVHVRGEDGEYAMVFVRLVRIQPFIEHRKIDE